VKFLLTIEFFCFLFVLTTSQLNGQDSNNKYYQVKGQIRDAESKNIIEFANIGIEGKPLGTVTNKAGRFDFKFDRKFITDSLYVHAMGFNTYKIALKEALSQKQFTIFLEPQPFNISEITIVEIPTMEIIKRALERIDENHSKNNYVMEGFYREYISENEKYKRLIESSIKIWEQSIKSQFLIPFLSDVKQITQVVEIEEIKQNEDYRALTSYDWNGIKYLLNENIHGENAGGVLNTYDLNNWKFNNTHTTKLNGENVFVVEFKTADKKAPRPEGTIYIAMEDYAIVQLDYSIDNEMLENWHLTRLSKNTVSKFYKWNTSFSYKRFEGKMFLNYITHNRSFDVLNVNDGNGVYDIQINAEFLTNNIYKQGVMNGAVNNIASDYNKALMQKKEFNESYWNNFNLPLADDEILSVYKSINSYVEGSYLIAKLPIINIPVFNQYKNDNTTLQYEYIEPIEIKTAVFDKQENLDLKSDFTLTEPISLICCATITNKREVYTIQSQINFNNEVVLAEESKANLSVAYLPPIKINELTIKNSTDDVSSIDDEQIDSLPSIKFTEIENNKNYPLLFSLKDELKETDFKNVLIVSPLQKRQYIVEKPKTIIAELKAFQMNLN